MTRFAIHRVDYRPGDEGVTIAVQALDGPFRGQVKDFYTTQAELVARVPLLGDHNWGDAEIRAVATEKLAAVGGVLQASE